MYYVHFNGKNHGPYLLDQIKSMWASGIITADAMYWMNGEEERKPISNLLAPENVIQPVTRPEAREEDISPSIIPVPTVSEKPEVGGDASKKKLIGVGGWLCFFCIQLTVISPLFSLGNIVETWDKLKPAIYKFPVIKNTIIFENTIFILLVIYGFIVGSFIWSGSPTGRKVAKQFLLIRLCGIIGMEIIALLMLLSALPWTTLSSSLTEVVGEIIREIVYFSLWWFYFKKSRRVINTYESEIIGSEQNAPQDASVEQPKDSNEINSTFDEPDAIVLMQPDNETKIRWLAIMRVIIAIILFCGLLKLGVVCYDAIQLATARRKYQETLANLNAQANNIKVNVDTQNSIYESLIKPLKKANPTPHDNEFTATKLKAEQGDVNAQYSLALMYYVGKGVTKDYAEAIVWFKKAAEQGYGPATVYLGDMYSDGEGVPKDIPEALKWYNYGRKTQPTPEELKAWFLKLQNERDGLDLNDAKTVHEFNQHAAEYQAALKDAGMQTGSQVSGSSGFVSQPAP